MESFSDMFELVMKELEKQYSDTIYNLWFKDMVLVSMENGYAIIAIKKFKGEIIEQKFMDGLCKAFENVFGFEVGVKFVPPDYEEVPEPEVKDNYEQSTFETFVVGSSNKFAHAAAQAVAANPGGAYNPLFIYGNSGLGKTHLMCAIKHEILRNNPNANIIFTQGETFTNDLVKHLAAKNMGAFHDKYRSADVLLVDDVQFIANKASTEEEFFYTFNALYQDGRQIVLSSDRPPKEMTTLEERLRTRFENGLIADIQPPDLETRMAIIKRKAELMDFYVPDDVVQYTATHLKNNIRQLEGAVNKMQAFVSLRGMQMNLITAQAAIKDIMSENRPTPLTIEKIIDEVSRTFGVDKEVIKSKRRDANTTKARQVAMYIISEVTGIPTKAIGEEFSGRDHSTVLYSLDEIKNKIQRDQSLKNTINEIIKNVQEG